MSYLIRKDSLIIRTAISGVTDSSIVERIIVLLDTGSCKELLNPTSMADNIFEWAPNETAEFPLRRIGLRLIVELENGRRFTVAESSLYVLKEYKESLCLS